MRKIKEKPKKKHKKIKPEEVKPKFNSRRPLDSLEIPEGNSFSTERGAVRTERDSIIESYVYLFKAALSEGMDRREIKKILGLRDDLFESVEKKVVNEDGQVEISKASPYRYYEYIQRQEKCVKDLEYFINCVDEDIQMYKDAYKKYTDGELSKPPSGRPNIQAGIMGIKARSDILDKMIKTGQDLGIVEKRAKELRVSGSVNLAALPTEKLSKLLSKKMNELKSLVKEEELPPVYDKMKLLAENNG